MLNKWKRNSLLSRRRLLSWYMHFKRHALLSLSLFSTEDTWETTQQPEEAFC